MTRSSSSVASSAHWTSSNTMTRGEAWLRSRPEERVTGAMAVAGAEGSPQVTADLVGDVDQRGERAGPA